MTDFIHICIESQRVFSLGRLEACARKRAGRNEVCTFEPALTATPDLEVPMATILSTARSLSAQDAPKIDGISARDDFLRKEAERGSRELLAAMIRELQSMGVVA